MPVDTVDLFFDRIYEHLLDTAVEQEIAIMGHKFKWKNRNIEVLEAPHKLSSTCKYCGYWDEFWRVDALLQEMDKLFRLYVWAGAEKAIEPRTALQQIIGSDDIEQVHELAWQALRLPRKPGKQIWQDKGSDWRESINASAIRMLFEHYTDGITWYQLAKKYGASADGARKRLVRLLEELQIHPTLLSTPGQ